MTENNKLFGFKGSINRKNYLLKCILLLVATLILAAGIIANMLFYPMLSIVLGGILALTNGYAHLGLTIRRTRGILSDDPNSNWYGLGAFLLMPVPYLGMLTAIILLVLPANFVKGKSNATS